MTIPNRASVGSDYSGISLAWWRRDARETTDPMKSEVSGRANMMTALGELVKLQAQTFVSKNSVGILSNRTPQRK